MRAAVLVLAFAACSSPTAAPDAAGAPDAATDATGVTDATLPDGPAGFGTLGGSGCGDLMDADITGSTPRLLRVDFDFPRAYADPADRVYLTPGGVHIAETPNAGGSSGMSEIFAFEELARCDAAAFYKTETEIVYDTNSKKTDVEIILRGAKIGVSVTRAFAFPLGTPYSLAQATDLLTRKLQDIPLATASVSAGDRWVKQFLAIMAIDTQAADTMVQAWAMVDATTKGDTIVIITTTTGADTWIYTNTTN